ncbi:type II secretion system protein GspD [Rubripirellula obstinata]|nr:secretin N-terminal domain-containing protein [Rubripirellula obstinata]
MDGCKTTRSIDTPAKMPWHRLLWCTLATLVCVSSSNAQLPQANKAFANSGALHESGLRALDLGGIRSDISAIRTLDSASAAPARIVRGRSRVIEATRSPMVAVLTSTVESDLPPSSLVVPANSTQQDAPQSADVNKKPASVEEALEARGSVTFRKTPLSEVVFLLSDLWHINIVAGENVNGEVSGSFHDAPLREVLSAVLTSSGYSYRKTGSSLVVLTADQVGSDDPSFVSDTLRIPEMLREDESALEAARMLLSERGQIRRLGNDLVLVIDSAARIDRVRNLFSGFGGFDSSAMTNGTGEFEQNENAINGNALASTPAMLTSGIAYFSPQYTEAEEMREPLQSALGDSVVVAVFPTENRIMVKGSAADLRLATEAIEQLDRPRSQVRITAMIYDVSLKEVERLGVNWNVQPHSRGLGLTDLNDAESLQFRNLITGSTGLITDTNATGAANLAVSSLNNTMNVGMLLQALQGNSEAKLLADPSVTVGDRRKASIRIVQKIPILAADPVENSGVVFSQVQFEEAGIILKVQPRISRDNTIDLQVQPEYSVVADFIANNPVIDTRTAETTVRVADGQTFVLGGLRQKSIVESTSGVPFLKDVKYIGKLFRSHDTEIRESELIVFIKPEIVTPYDCGNARQREAAYISNRQLDEIPHAQEQSMIPCCNDKHCPNHHPTCRANGGSEGLKYTEALRFGECDPVTHPTYESPPENAVHDDQVPVHPQDVPQDVPQHLPQQSEFIEEGYFEPIHVHEAVLQ